MPYPAVFIQKYLRVSLNPLRTNSFQLRRRLHLSPRLIRPLPPSSRPALVLICSSSSSHVSSSKHLIKRTRNKDSYSLPYFYQQSLPYGRYAYDEYASEEESDRENLQLPQSLVSFIYVLFDCFDSCTLLSVIRSAYREVSATSIANPYKFHIIR